jgi:uncharacterized membrane protein
MVIWAFFFALFADARALLAKIGVTGTGFEPPHGNPDERDSCIHEGNRIGLDKHHEPLEIGRRSWVVSAAIGDLYGTLMALLFSRIADGTCSSVAPVDKLSVVMILDA